MSQLVEVLYPLPDIRRTPLSLLRWWETRRLAYNKAVGAAGLVTLAGASLISALPPHTMGLELPGMLIGSVVYAFLANACYSLGWVAELAAQKLWGRRTPDIGPLLFRQGLIFSVGLTLLPLLLLSVIWMIQVVVAVAS